MVVRGGIAMFLKPPGEGAALMVMRGPGLRNSGDRAELQARTWITGSSRVLSGRASSRST
jgi:hypothetical protein